VIYISPFINNKKNIMKIKTRIEDAIASSITESSINPAGNSRLDNRSLPPVSNCSKNAYDAFN
jgi:hypothetical protein